MAAHARPGPISPALQNSYGPEATLFEHRPQDGPQVVAFDAPEAIPGQSPYHGYVSKPYEEKQPPSRKERRKKILGLPVALFWVLPARHYLYITITITVILGNIRPNPRNYIYSRRLIHTINSHNIISIEQHIIRTRDLRHDWCSRQQLHIFSAQDVLLIR
ncbi:hypothetical protein INS49_014906 [Diaporthe citri]|uniref:uncharacterized protein n=1 Tax=Diaporthe citri TaxID=83186 RepID=UPI001C80ACA5|nr:uncharacterized protein INS49_014906 [Diaporthe citri]KAG6357030.1 hypothetical protein INS49_014906 [Diaporthe citri]